MSAEKAEESTTAVIDRRYKSADLIGKTKPRAPGSFHLFAVIDRRYKSADLIGKAKPRAPGSFHLFEEFREVHVGIL